MTLTDGVIFVNCLSSKVQKMPCQRNHCGLQKTSYTLGHDLGHFHMCHKNRQIFILFFSEYFQNKDQREWAADDLAESRHQKRNLWSLCHKTLRARSAITRSRAKVKKEMTSKIVKSKNMIQKNLEI